MRITQLLVARLSQVNELSWSSLRWKISLLHTSCARLSESVNKDNLWGVPFHLKDPELNLPFLLNPSNRDIIRQNVADRKGVGDVDRVVELYGDLSEATDDDVKGRLRRLFLEAAADIPNMSHPESPVGDEDKANIVDIVRGKMEPPADEGYLKTTVELAENMGHLRTSNVSMTTGHSTYYFLDKLAQLELALVKYTIHYLQQQGFELLSVPDLLHPDIIEGCGFKTTGEVSQVYRLDRSRHPDLCLAGTSEMAIAGYFSGEVFQEAELPVKLAAVSRCYRAETSHTEAESGIYRVHQFTKVEMFGVTKNETGDEGNELLKEVVDIQKTLFSQLGLHFRVLDMPTTELGASAHRKYDIEAWMPGKQMWGEISSASNCTDYQSRRLHIKYQHDQDRVHHCVTVNGTACAVPRMIMALLETYQNQDGSVNIPEVLQPYMDDQTIISKSLSVPQTAWIKTVKLKKVNQPSSNID